jgi:lipopolysaccharide export system permease protein
MSRLNRYVFRQLFWATLVVLVTLACVVWLSQSLRFVELIVNRGMSAPLFIYFTALLLPSFIHTILPIALFIAILFVYNRLMVDSELVVMRAAGLSQRRLALPALLLAGLCTLAGYALSAYLVPASYRSFKELQNEIRDSFTSVLLQEGVFNTLTQGVTVYIRSRDPNGDLRGIVVHDGRNKTSPVTMMAERGALVQGRDGPRVVMASGNRQEVDSATGRASLLYFDQYVFDIGAFGEPPGTRWREPRERFIGELFAPEDSPEMSFNYRKLRVEGHHRLVSPLLSLAFAAVALACLLTGQFNRRGQARRIATAAGVVLALEIGMIALKSAAERDLDFAVLMHAVVGAALLAGAAFLVFDPRRRRRAPAALAAASG